MDANSWNGEPGACRWDREHDPEDGADELPLAICSVCGDAIEVGQGTTDAEQEGGLICPRCARGPLPQADGDGR